MKKFAIAVMLLMSTPVMADTITGVSGGPPKSTVSGGPPEPQTGGGAPLTSGKSEPYTNNPSNQTETAPPAPGAIPMCQPIGRTDDGHLVYSMDCQSVPVMYTTGGKLQNSNPTGFPPSQTIGAMPETGVISKGTPPEPKISTPPSGYSNVTPPVPVGVPTGGNK